MEPIRVFLVDSEEVFREGLARLLKEQPRIEVIYQCGSGKEVIEKSKDMKPDVILVDSQISDISALEIAQAISSFSPEVKVALIARPGTEAAPLEFLQAGARACLAKSISVVDLVKSIELISSGRIIVSPVFAQSFLEEINSPGKAGRVAATEAVAHVSEREMEIVQLVAQGATNKEIAKNLIVAESTVKVHVGNILKKLELRNRQQLAVYAVLQNWVVASAKAEGKDSQTDI